MTEQIDSNGPLILGCVPELDANRPEGREWRHEAVNRAALFWYVGQGSMDGPMYEALHDAVVKLFPAKPATDRD